MSAINVRYIIFTAKVLQHVRTAVASGDVLLYDAHMCYSCSYNNDTALVVRCIVVGNV